MNEHTTLELRELIVEYLTDHDVTIDAIADEAFTLQKPDYKFLVTNN